VPTDYLIPSLVVDCGSLLLSELPDQCDSVEVPEVSFNSSI